MKKALVLILIFSMLLSLFSCTEKTENIASDSNNDSENNSANYSEELPIDRYSYFGKGIYRMFDRKCEFSIDNCSYDSSSDIKHAIKFDVTVKNGSSDSAYAFGVRDIKINGVACIGILDGFLVYAGETKRSSISFKIRDDEIEEKVKEEGIGYFTDIELTLYVKDAGNNFKEIVRQTEYIYPYGEDMATQYLG